MRRSIWLRHDAGLAHDVPGHPERPARIRALEAEMSAADWFGCSVVEAPRAPREALEAVHPASHVDFIRSLSEAGGGVEELPRIVELAGRQKQFAGGQAEGGRAAFEVVRQRTIMGRQIANEARVVGVLDGHAVGQRQVALEQAQPLTQRHCLVIKVLDQSMVLITLLDSHVQHVRDARGDDRLVTLQQVP